MPVRLADADGFYDVPALAPAVDGFFVMAYQLNLDGHPPGDVSADQRHVRRSGYGRRPVRSRCAARAR